MAKVQKNKVGRPASAERKGKYLTMRLSDALDRALDLRCGSRGDDPNRSAIAREILAKDLAPELAKIKRKKK